MITHLDPHHTTVYLAHPDYREALCNELGVVSRVQGNLVFSPREKTDICFALDVWLKPTLTHFESISEAVRLLRAAGPYWLLNPLENIRRSRLIESELKKLPTLSNTFPLDVAFPTIGCFSLLDKNTLVFSQHRWKKPPLGLFHFQEDKINPPNRAYLKLWEALSLLEHYPQKEDTAIDLGASPGGWTYVMQTLGTRVTGVDKAPLDPSIAALPHVSFIQQSAFALDPKEHPCDWLLCDVACYPERTYELIQRWIKANTAKQLIFTIKLQGETDFELLHQFQQIPNSCVIHLFYNKHEVTFFYPKPKTLELNF